MRRSLGAAMVLAMALTGAARAQPAEGGWRLHTDLGLRGIPVGVNAITDVGWRVPLFDSESLLLRKTYLDVGLTNGLSPAYLWAGAYIETLPVALLQLRLSAQYMQFFGTFGHLFEPSPTPDDWSLDDVDDRGGITEGKVTHGLLVEGRATPRLKLGNVVAFAELRFMWLSVEDVGDTWYEPYYDIALAATDQMLVARPTLGYLLMAEDPTRTYLLVGARWERTQTVETDLTRDLIAGLILWKIPTDWWASGSPKLAVLAGGWAQHPLDRGAPYVAAQLSLDYGAQ